MNDSESIYRTTKIPTTFINQNQVDIIHDLLFGFCKHNKNYQLFRIKSTNNKIVIKSLSQLKKVNTPTLNYLVCSKSNDTELSLTIDQGIVINIRNGNFLVYGLYQSLVDELNIMKVNSLLVFLRKYWLFNLLISLWIVPAVLLAIIKDGGWGMWLAVYPVIIISLARTIALISDDNDETWIDRLEWSDVVLRTKIKYGVFNNHLGSPLFRMITSTQSLVSIITSFATIISFIFLILNKWR